MEKVKNKWENFKLLWQLVHEYKKTIMLWILVKIIVSAFVPFIQLLIMSKVIQWLTEGIPVELFVENLLIWMLAVILLTSLEVLLNNKFDYFSETLLIKMIPPITYQQLSLDYPLTTGKEGSRKFWDAMMLVDHRGTSLGRVLDEWVAVGTAVFSVGIYFFTLFKLENNFLFIILFTLLGLSLLKKRQKTLKDKQRPALLKNWRQFNYLEKIIGDNRIAKDLRLYHMKDWFHSIKEALSGEYQRITADLRWHKMIENVFVTFALVLLSLLAYWRSIALIIQGALPVSEFVVYVGVVTLITQSLMNLVSQVTAINVSLSEVSAYTDFMKQEAIFNHKDGLTVPDKIDDITFHNVSYTYPSNKEASIKQLSISFKGNEKIAIVGSNGAGKTTLVKLLLGLLKPDTGEILINGRLQAEYNIHELYNLFSPIFQDYVAFTFTIRDAIIQGYPFDEEKYLRVLRDSGMNEIIAQLPDGDKSYYVKEVHFNAVQLSGGQTQRLKLAQALYKDSPILVLDEPTAALDPIAESKVYEAFEGFTQGKMAIFISHRLASTRFCDRILYMDEGTIAEAGSHDQLMAAQGKYYNLFETQAYYYREELNETQVIDVISDEMGGVL